MGFTGSHPFAPAAEISKSDDPHVDEGHLRAEKKAYTGEVEPWGLFAYSDDCRQRVEDKDRSKPEGGEDADQ